MANNAARVAGLEPVEEIEKQRRQYQNLCFALLRMLGRVRVPAAVFAGLGPRDQLKFHRDPVNDDLTVSYEAGPQDDPEKTDTEEPA